MRFLQNKKQFDQRSLFREFKPGEIVMIKSFHLSNAEKNVSGKLFPQWEAGKVLRKLETFSNAILKTDKKVVKMNIKLMKGLDIKMQQQLTYLFD